MANTVYDYLKETYDKYGANSSSGAESGATEKKTVYDYLAETVKLQETEYAEKQESAVKNVQSWLDRYNSTVNGFNDYASKAKDDWYADYGENWYRDMLGVLDDWEGIRKDAASIGYDSRGAYDDLKSLADSIGKQREYYASLFQTQEEYDQYRKQEEMLGVDLNAVSQEIAGLKQQRSDYIRANVNDRRVTSKKDAYLQGIKDWDAKIAERENYFNEAKELQTQKAMLGADLNALQREVESLTARRERYAQDHDYDWTDQGQRAAHEAYLQEQDSLIAQKKQYLNRARYLQEQAKLSWVADRNSEYYDPEFRRYSQYQSTQKENPAWWESGVGDTQYEWINNPNGFRDQYERTASDLDRQAGAPQKPRFAGETESAYYQKGYDQLTKDEISIYNYYYSRYGKEKAQDYLDSIQETLNHRKAAGMYAGMEDDVAQELIFGVEAGLDQFQSGISSLLNTEDDYIPFSATQMASGMVREDLADFGPKLPKGLGGASLGQAAYDTVTTTANMAPSMISSMAIGMLNPVAGEIAGNVLLGASAAGNAYQEMRNCGYDKDSSRAYSALVGASEAGLQYLLGGIGKLGGTLSGNAIAKITEGVDNAFLRTAIQLGGNMLSEGTEEGLQEILTPWFQNLVFHADENVNWDEVAYSSLLGALTAGLMEGGETISGEVNTYRSGRQIQKAGVSGKELADIGNTFSADTVAYKLAGKVNENTDAYTLGRLFQEIDAQITEANIADIQMGLEQKGFPKNTARKNAEVFANVVAGANFTDRQIAVIESNEALAETVREVIIDRNSTVNQRTKGYNEVLAALAREKSGEVSKAASQNTSRTEQDSPGQKNEEATAKVSTTEKETSETDTGPSVVKKISSIQNGNIRVTLQDGTESRVQDADIAPEDGVRIETVAGIDGITAEDANFILQTLRTNAGVSAQADALGAKEAYTYGYFGYSEDHIAKHGVFANSLTKPQRDAIYQLGQKARARDGNTILPRQAKYENGAKAGIYFESENGVVSFQEAGKKNLSEKQEAGVRTAMVLNKLGIGGDIIFYESYKNSSGEIVYKDRNGVERKAPNGFYSEDGSIHVDLNAGAKSDGLVLYTMSHELTHFIEQWSPQKFKVLADFLIENYEKGTSMDSLVRLKREKIAKLRGVDAQSIPYKEAYSEVIADSMEAMLSDGNVLDKLVSLKARDSSIFGKMKQFFDNLAQKIRKAYEGVRPDSAEGRAVLEMRDSVERIQGLFAEALANASENYRGTNDTKNTAQEGGVKYSVRETDDGRSVAVVDDDILSHIDTTFWNSEKIKAAKAAARNALEQFSDGITVNGITRKVNRVSKNEFTRSNYTEKLANRDTDTFANKMRMADVADDIVTVATGWRKDGKLSHPRKDNFVDFDHGYALIMAGENQYNAEIAVGITDRGEYVFYDVTNIEPDSFKLKKESLTTATTDEPSGDIQRDSFGGRVSQNGEKVKRKFSMRETVEETKDLIAVHNISEEKLLKSLNLGGLPMPSIAILRAKDGHSNFGDISLVFGKDTIDPELYRANKVYSGDAYTPTYPRVEYKASAKAEKKVSTKYYELAKKIGYEEVRPLFQYVTELENMLNRDGGESAMLERLYNDTDMMQVYLQDTGREKVQPVTHEVKTEISEDAAQMNQYFIDELGEEFISNFDTNPGNGILGGRKAYIAEHEAEILDAYKNICMEHYGFTQEEADNLLDNTSQRDLFGYLRNAYDYLQNKGVTVRTETDAEATREKIREASADGYREWVDGLFKGVQEKEGIRNNKEYFTPSGNRRSFEALHYENTLENVVKAMRETGEKGIGFGTGSIFGASTTEFSSIDEIKSEEGRLQKLSDEEYQKIKQGFTDRFFELASSLPKNTSSFSALDDAANMLIEAVAKFKTKSGMANYLRRESQGWAKYSDYVLDDLLELVNDIRSMPTGYFEAKPQRAVGFDEVVAVVAPDNLGSEVSQKLSDMGVNVVSYEHGNEESRTVALNSLENVKFSQRDSDGNDLTVDQAEYFRNSKVRDKDGNLLVMYHGTPNGGFTKFRSGSYFTENPEYAAVYQSPGASMLSHKKGADNPKRYQVYLNIEKPFDTRNTKERRIFMQEYYRQYGTGAPLSESGLPDWTDGMDLQEFIEDMGYDYDGLILDEGATGGYGEEVKSRGLSYVTFHPEQVKNVDNTTPTSDPDIRYSDRDPEMAKVNRALEKENAKLREDVVSLKDLLKLQRQVTGGTKFTKTSVEAAAGLLMKSSNAKGNKAELAKILNGFYEYIAKGDDLTWEGVSEQAQRAVQWLQEHENIKKEIDGYAQDILREIRENRFYLDENQKKEAAYQYGSYNEWRKKTMGSTTVANDAKTSLDSLWGALSEKYPNIFDPNTTSTDMPAALLDAIDTLRNMKPMDDYAYDAELAAQDLTRQVYESYWNVSTLYTAADVKQKQINRLKIEHSKRMDALKADHRNAVAQLKTEHKAELTRVKQEYRQNAEKKQAEIIKRYQDSRAKGVESRRKTAMRQKVKDVVNELNQYLLKGTKERHVPIQLQKAVAEALDAVNMDTVGAEERVAKLKADLLKAKTPEQVQQISRTIDRVQSMGDKMDARLKSLKEAYDSFLKSDDPLIANSHDEVISAKLESVIENVGETPLRDMSLAQLEEVHDMYRAVLTTVRNANKVFKANRNETVSTLGYRVMEEVEQAGGKKQYSTKMMDEIRKFGWNNLKPVYAFSHIGSKTLSDIFDKVRAGEDTWARDITDARAFYLAEAKKYGYDSWDTGERHSFTSTSGKEFGLNLEQIMSLYAYSKREQAADHLRKGGIVIDESTEITMKTKLGLKVTFNPTEATAYNISDETLGEIIGKLTPEQKAFVDEMQGYLSTTMGNKGNEVSLEMYGVKLFKEKNYFPLKSASQYMPKAKEQQEGNVRIKNSGFSKETVKGASNPIVLTPFMQVWADHVNDMSMYHAFVLPMEDFYRVYNFKTGNSDIADAQSVNAAIQNAYGKGATAYIDQLMKDLNGGGRTDSTTGVINKGMNVYKKGAVFANASVAIQQPSAIARATALVDLKYFIGPKVDHKRHAELWDEVKQYAPVAAIKEMGYFDTNMGKSTQDYLLGKEYNGIKEKAEALFKDSGYRDEALSKLPSLADEVTWCAIWEACKREAQAKNPGMKANSEEFLKKVGDRFTEVIVKTQVYDSVLSRSANMRSKETGMKMATAFMAEPTTSINMAADAILKAKRGGAEGRRYCRRVIGSVVAAQILNAFLVSWVYAARDDDDDESYAEKYIGSFSAEVLDGMNPLTYIPFLKDLASIVRGYDVERSDISAISDLWAACKRLESDDLSPWRKAEGFVGGICQIFGLPVKNIMRDVRAAYQAFDTLVNGEKTTARGIQYAVQSAFTGKRVSNKEQLYEARLAGDSEHAARVEGRYEDEDSANAAVRAAIKEKFLDDKIDADAALRQMVQYAGMDASEAHWLMDAWKYRKEVGSDDGYSKFNNFYEAVRTGKDLKNVIKEYTDNGIEESTLSKQITEKFKPEYVSLSAADRAGMKGYLLNAYEQCGVDREKAKARLDDWDFESEYGFAYADRKEAYKDGIVSAEKLRTILIEYGNYSEEDAAFQIEVYDWENDGISGATTAAVRDYNEYCADAGVSREDFMEIRNFSNSTENDVDENGKKIAYSAMKKIMAKIDSLTISNAQKTALARSMGWKEANIQKYKLWD